MRKVTLISECRQKLWKWHFSWIKVYHSRICYDISKNFTLDEILWIVAIYLTERCFKLHSIIYFVVKECYIYSCVVSVDHVPCGNESQFEKWWQDRKQNPVGVTYPIHHSIISNKNKVSQTVIIFLQNVTHKIPTWLC